VVEIRCRVEVGTARERYRHRRRDERHLDRFRTEDELWGSEVPPLGVGRLITVQTSEPVDVAALADRIRASVNR